MIDPALLAILACPETGQELELAAPEDIQRINAAIAAGQVTNRTKEKVNKPIDGGLFRKGDRKHLYPIRHGVPILLVDELLSLEKVEWAI